MKLSWYSYYWITLKTQDCIPLHNHKNCWNSLEYREDFYDIVQLLWFNRDFLWIIGMKKQTLGTEISMWKKCTKWSMILKSNDIFVKKNLSFSFFLFYYHFDKYHMVFTVHLMFSLFFIGVPKTFVLKLLDLVYCPAGKTALWLLTVIGHCVLLYVKKVLCLSFIDK